jgi:hypothetical protein
LRPLCHTSWEKGGRYFHLRPKLCGTPWWNPLSWPVKRMVARARVLPMMVASKPPPMGERFMPLNRSVKNSRIPMLMVLPREKTSHDSCSLSVAMTSADDGTIRMSRGKHAAIPSSWHTNYRCFLYQQDAEWSRSCVLVLRWSCKLLSTLRSILVRAPH